DRLARIARVHGIPAEVLTYDITTPVRPSDVETALQARTDLSHVAVVHHETTTGLLNPVMDVARVAARARRRVPIGAMSSLFRERLDVDADGVDFVMASANKCLQAVPGIAFVLGRRSAIEALASEPPRSVYLDLHGHYATQERDNTPFTPAVQELHAMRQALVELEAEGAERRSARYAENARALRGGRPALGVQSQAPQAARDN